FCSKTFDPATDLPDLSSKVILITGGNVGIGYGAVKYLAQRSAKVYMAARNASKTEAAIEQLQAEGLGPGNGQVLWIKLDMQDPRNAKNMAEEFMKLENKLDVLSEYFKNTGNACTGRYRYYIGSIFLLSCSYLLSLLSPFVLTRSLLLVLERTASEPDSDVRIVVVSSVSHEVLYGVTPRFRNVDDLNTNAPAHGCPLTRVTVSLSKPTNTLYAKELQRRLTLQGKNITVIALQPGNVDTFFHKPELASWR
ncbi:hypothetical protein BJ138DRAFT_997608, partial [Hygrophoropsis aurantiaca]